MGRYYCHRKATVEESLDVTVSKLKKWGMLKGDHSVSVITWVFRLTGKESHVVADVHMTGEPYVEFIYIASDREGNIAHYNTEASLITTPCNLGGVRYWFACPMCWERVGCLYIAPGERKFMCRRCNCLSYHSRNESNVFGILGVNDRKMKKLQSEIKRWTWRGRPTRKVRRLLALQRKMGILSPQASACFDRFKTRLN